MEAYFGSQRSLGHQYDNQDFSAFGYIDNTVRIQRNFGLKTGNDSETDHIREMENWVQLIEHPFQEHHGNRNTCNSE